MSGEISDMTRQYFDNGEFLTLEVKYTPAEIMETHREELLIDEKHVFGEPTLKFFPYLLLEIKYTQDHKNTREGFALWSQVDGEMVINTETWDKTHGFEDAIKAKATRPEFTILNTLAKHHGSLTREKLQKELRVEEEALTPWVESALGKHLIIQMGNELKLHFQNPKILVTPETKMTQALVTKSYNYMHRIGRKYTSKEIERVAKAAFGQDFTVRDTKEVFLPVYCIEVKNPDDSSFTSVWNALNGERITPHYLSSN